MCFYPDVGVNIVENNKVKIDLFVSLIFLFLHNFLINPLFKQNRSILSCWHSQTRICADHLNVMVIITGLNVNKVLFYLNAEQPTLLIFE